MEELKGYFNLQRFAEGDDIGAGVDDDGESETSEDPLAIPGKLGLTEDGQLQYIEEDGEDSSEKEGADDEGEGDDQEKGHEETGANQSTYGDDDGEKKPSFYSPDELFGLASANPAALDPARIPPESLPLYRALVAKQAAPTEPKPPEQKPADKTYTPEDIAEAAKKAVVQELAAKGEEFDEYNVAHQRLLFKYESQFERYIEETASQKQRQDEARQSIYSKIETRAKELEKQAGADFPGIDQLSATHLHTLSYAKAAPIAVAIDRMNNGQATEADIPVLEGYWEDCRREYFAKKTGVAKEAKQVPPQTLKPGNDKEAKEKFDAKEIGKMNQDERIEYYKRTGWADRLANLGN